MSYDPSGKGSLVVDGLRGQHLLATPSGGLYVTSNGDKPGDSGSVWFVKDGKKTLVDSGLKFATGLAYRPDQWLLSVADGHSKWAYSYQINADGTLDEQGAVLLAARSRLGRRRRRRVDLLRPGRARCWSRRAGASRCARTTARRR